MKMQERAITAVYKAIFISVVSLLPQKIVRLNSFGAPA
jgi:hypothetical protein